MALKSHKGNLVVPQRVLGAVMGHTSPNHHRNSYYRNPTFYYIGTLDSLVVEALFSTEDPSSPGAL